MADQNKILVVIPARGGSKRLPRKNVLPLGGKPLICWTIETALNTDISARILVTSDDEEILDLVAGYGLDRLVAHKRAQSLARDTSSTADAVIDAIEAERGKGHPSDTIILLQPTSPLRNSTDILNALSVYEDSGRMDTVVSVCEVDHPTGWIGHIDEDLFFEGANLTGKRSQDYQKEYRLNGAVYVVSTDNLLGRKSLFTDRIRASAMPRRRSFDIDEEIDFQICETLIGD